MNFVLENHTGLTILAKNGIIVIKRPLGSLWKWMKRWRDWDMRPHFSTKESGFFSFICPLCCYRLIVTTLSWNVCKSKLRRHKMGLQDQHNKNRILCSLIQEDVKNILWGEICIFLKIEKNIPGGRDWIWSVRSWQCFWGKDGGSTVGKEKSRSIRLNLCSAGWVETVPLPSSRLRESIFSVNSLEAFFRRLL